MRTIPVVLAAGVVNEYPVAARYFRLMATIGPVDVDLMRGAAVVYEARNVEAGFWAIPEGGLTGFRIKSPTSQTIYVAVTQGNGGYDRSAGSVTVTSQRDTNGNSIDTLAALAGVGSERRLLVTEGGHIYGASFSSVANLAPNTPENIWAAGSNGNGAVVWAARAYAAHATLASQLSLVAKATAPASAQDGDQIATPGNVSNTGSSIVTMVQLERPIRVASGLRGDWIGQITETVAKRSVLYTLM